MTKELTVEEADTLVLGESPETNPKLLNPDNTYYGQLLDGVKVETKDGIIPIRFSPHNVVENGFEFQRLVKSARCKIEKGDAITALELYALMRARVNVKQSISDDRVPSRVKEVLDEAAKLGVEEGVVTANELAQRTAKSPTTIKKYLKRYSQYYKDALQRAYDQTVAQDKLAHNVVRLRLMRGMMAAASEAPAVVHEVMTDPEEPGATRIKAAFGAMGTFGVGPEQKVQIERVTNVNAETINIAKETLQLEGFIETEAQLEEG